ncbi:MAG: hypothetical protein ACRD3D_13165 [Terriglobia bacterium]
MNPFIKQNDGAPPPRHALGLWLNYRKLTSAAYVPNRRERVKLRGGKFYGVVINWSLLGYGVDQFKGVVPGWFYATQIVAFGSVNRGPGITEGFSVTVYDPARGVVWSDQQVIGTNSGGGTAFGASLSGFRNFYLKQFYLFQPRTPILAQIKEITGVNNSGQIVIYGYIVSSPNTGQ